MKYLTELLFPSFVTVIIVISIIIEVRKKQILKRDHLILTLVVEVFVILMLGRYFLDFIFVLGSYSKLYELPSRTDYITEIKLNKDSVPSELILDGKSYEVDKYLVKDKIFFTNKKYTIIYTPITKSISNIYE